MRKSVFPRWKMRFRKVVSLWIVVMMTLSFMSVTTELAVSAADVGTADFNVVTDFSPSNLVPNQMLTAKVTATNISTVPYSGKTDVLVIVGLYDINNTMVNVSYISKGIAYQGTEVLTAGFKLPSNTTGYVARAFMWDGTDLKTSNMTPISNAVQIPGTGITTPPTIAPTQSVRPTNTPTQSARPTTTPTQSVRPTNTPTPTATVIPTQTTYTPGEGRMMEKLDRGVTAVKVNNGVFVSWRMFGTDPSSIAFNLYRNGTKVNSSPITTSTNYSDAGGSASSTYQVAPVLNGQEQAKSETASVWGQNYLQVPIQAPVSGYAANDCSTGDLDGDGQYEIVVKWEGATNDNANAGVTDPVCLEGYKLNGTRLWTINLGKNIRGGAHYTQFLVADFDGNGKAEVACKTADGTKDGKGKVIGDANANYVNSSGYILTGPEFFTVFSGQTGEALATANYDPPRGTVSAWGDNYGNRVDRFLACVAYLDGKLPSAVMCRGYYTRMTMAAWDFRNGKLTERWLFDTNKSNSNFKGQGNHNISVADVDSDGKDEIVCGACAVDDNGTGMYTTGLGHGDAMHLGDLDPSRPGLEVWTCHEGSGGADLHDAKTGQILFRWTASGDTGRACTADLVASSPGEELWAAGSPLFSATGKNLGTAPGQKNFAIWWDGDELRELLDGTSITKYGGGTLLNASGCSSNNGTKSTPCLQADILGDWREEAIWRTSDNKYLRIYTTTNITERRIYTLMHDPVYRDAVAWQNAAYNVPPHTGFFIGSGMSTPPTPKIYLGP